MEERIIVDCRKHWISFVTSAVLVILFAWYGVNQIILSANFSYYGSGETAVIGAALLMLAVFIGIHAVIVYRSNYLQITESWIIGKSSRIASRQQVSPIDKVVNVTVSRGPLGSLLGYSNVVIYTSGSVFSSFVYRGVTNGDLLQEKFMEIKKAADAHKTDSRSTGAAPAAEHRSEASRRAAAVILCKSCGRSIEAGRRVCPYCGKNPTADTRASAEGWKAPGAL